MGRKTHAEFRGEFEERLKDYIQAEMPVPDGVTLERKYITKLAPDLKKAFLNNFWPLDGEDMPARKPTLAYEGRRQPLYSWTAGCLWKGGRRRDDQVPTLCGAAG